LDVDSLIEKIVKYTDYILGYNWLVYYKESTCITWISARVVTFPYSTANHQV
jgi:hypothetical protein